jgi:hypothetical protein
MRHLRLLAAPLLASGCVVANNAISVPYDLPPQEFKQDFGMQSGTLMHVPCTSDALCMMIQTPMGSTAACDATTMECKLVTAVRLITSINLSQQQGFPDAIAKSSAVQGVTVGAVHYWTASNSLNIATPPIDIYVGPQSVQTETDEGAVLLGTVASLPAGMLTACRNGTPGTQAAYCDMPLSPDGQAALAMLAKSYQTPFNVLVVAHLEVHGGDPIPSGLLDLFVQPSLAFEVIPVK